MPTKKRKSTCEYTWLVFHQKEPFFYSSWGSKKDGDRYEGPTTFDNRCVGAYSTEKAAIEEARKIWNSCEKDDGSCVFTNPSCNELGGYFWDSVLSNTSTDADPTAPSERVYVLRKKIDAVNDEASTVAVQLPDSVAARGKKY
mmetsp:Transcript_23080/g.48035  ORF Transcript_23080/g.48035 Transcript_23080/m.48035 type:complete len:143 (+) Transcript_23080:2922-3350(+)